jgi:hypothetical protein
MRLLFLAAMMSFGVLAFSLTYAAARSEVLGTCTGPLAPVAVTAYEWLLQTLFERKMLTIFTVPKAFKAHIGLIQLNAITSWSVLTPRPEIILFGDEEGTAELATELRLRHIPDVSRNEYGTPLLNRVFEQAQDFSCYDTLCYINADIILLSDFMRAVRQVSLWRPPYLMIGRRWNIDLAERIEFECSDWEARLRAIVFQRSRPSDSNESGVDYLVFTRGLFPEIPPFAVGRWWWDHWLVWKALSQSVPVADASTKVIAIHQNHRYDHIPERLSLKEFEQNQKLAGGLRQWRTFEDATHTLTACENVIVIKPKSSFDMLFTSLRGAYQRWSRRMNWNAGLSASMNPLFPWFLWLPILNATRPFRHYLGLRQVHLVRLLTRFKALGSFHWRGRN